jgi:flagellar motor protein MotB
MSDEHKEKHDDHGGGGSHGGGGHGGGHGGGGHEEAHEGAPEWLISFADNVMLQMGFFVILLAMNMGPKGGGSASKGENQGGQTPEMLDFVLSIREGFGNPVSIFSDKPEERPLVKRMLEKKGGEGRSDGPTGKHEKQQAPRPSDYDRVTAVVMFEDRQSELSSDARTTIADIAQRQKDQRWILEVRGHVSPFESMRSSQRAMQLSYDRALAVANALVESGMQWANIRVVACGDQDRLVARGTNPEQSRGNQRVEIVVTNYTVGADPYAAPPDK